MNIATGEQRYSQIARITDGEDYYITSKYVYSDGGKLYAVITDYTDSDSTALARERVVCVNDKYDVEQVCCSIDYDESEGLQVSKLSGLCCAGEISSLPALTATKQGFIPSTPKRSRSA